MTIHVAKRIAEATHTIDNALCLLDGLRDDPTYGEQVDGITTAMRGIDHVVAAGNSNTPEGVNLIRISRRPDGDSVEPSAYVFQALPSDQGRLREWISPEDAMPPYLGAEPQPSTIVADRYHSSGAATSLIGLAPIRHAQARGIAAIHAFARLQPLITVETPLVQYCHVASRQEAIALTIMNAGRLCIAIMQHGDKSGKTTEWITENTARLRHHPSSAPLRMSPRYLDVVKACREGPIVRQLFRELLQANAHHESFTKGAASPGLALHQSATIT